MKALFNNNLIDTPLPIMPDNRAFQFGDGIFETIWYRNERVPLLDQHIHRLKHSAGMLGLEISAVDLKYLKENIETLRQLNFPTHDSVVAKLMCWRHASDRPGYWADQRTTDTLLTVRPYTRPPESADVAISERIRICTYPWSSAKSMNAMPYVMASIECRERSLDELVLCNQNGEIAECISSNLFIYDRDGMWYTPPLSSGCVAGTMRAFILENSDKALPHVKEKTLLPDDLKDCHGMVLTRATGLAVVHRLNGKSLPSDPAGDLIMQVMEQL